MQGLVQISACVLLLCGLALSNPVGDCPPANPEDFHIPDDSDCTIFYKCAHGVPVKFDCPAPLHFNARISVCDWPENAGCAAGGGNTPENTEPPVCECTCAPPSTTATPATTRPTPETTTTPETTRTPSTTTPTPETTTTTPTPETTRTPSTPETTRTTATPSRTEPTTVATTRGVCDAIGTCPVYTQDSLAVHLPHRTKCDVYCRCDHGVPIEMPCAPGTWFNAALQVCDWPANSGCVPGEGPTSPPATTKPTVEPTAAPPSSTTIVAPVDPVCDAVGVCPIYDQFSIVKHLPHRTRCDVYCRCNHGVPIEMPCPTGTFFNAILEVCDHPGDSGCVPNGPRK